MTTTLIDLLTRAHDIIAQTTPGHPVIEELRATLTNPGDADTLGEVVTPEWRDRLERYEPDLMPIPAISHVGRVIRSLFDDCDRLTTRMDGERTQIETVQKATLQVAAVMYFG